METGWIAGLLFAVAFAGGAVREPAAALPAPAQAGPQAPPPAAQQPAGGMAPPGQRDPVLQMAADQIGRALFLRCFCADNNLDFDAQGRPAKLPAKLTDWTLAAVNVLSVQRRPAAGAEPAAIELDGVRAAVRYAPDRREFDRHPQNDVKMRILIAVPNGAAINGGDSPQESAAFGRALHAVLAQGIDLPLQRSLPAYWQHYFNPQTPWAADALTGQVVVTPGDPKGSQVSEAVVIHKAEAAYTGAAEHDHVQGTVVLRLVVDAEGVPQRIAVAQPLGYGLDAKAAEATARLRFTPAMLDGKPVASYTLLRQEFVVVPIPR